MEKPKKLIWTEPARQDLKDIFVFQSEFSHKSADKIINKIFEKVEILLILGFELSGQIDNINPKYRRLIEGNYKILYKVYPDKIVIHGIFDARQQPAKLKLK
ncbi:MAG: type II toxin-antitoxin system RelE/ParE family toxin [Bacteroidales bacterium]|nr:type II toxin-antitoxin system RelE/ParE family toxin [Bacteroidales bacterium]